MPRIEWDKTGEKLYETGCDQGVVFVKDETGAYSNGVAWNGLIGVDESPSGGEANPFYADNQKYLNLMSNEEFGCSIKAYTFPEEFEVCDGCAEPEDGVILTQQTRREFGFSYRTLIGNDVKQTDLGYKIHLVYNALAAPSSKSNNTVNESPEAQEFSWEVTTTPVKVAGYKPVAHIVINSTRADPTKLKALEDMIYGSESDEPTLPTPQEVLDMFKAA